MHEQDRTFESLLPISIRGRQGSPKQRVNDMLNGLLAHRVRPRILEAGCGSTSHIALPHDRYLVGIDIAQRQLDKNTSLDEKHLADLQSFPLPAQGFDLIVCWDVIEHLQRPMEALNRMTAALNAGGSLLLAFPNFWSLKGLVTKFTPYKIHELFYRHVIGDKRKKDEWDQFETTLRYEIRPMAIRRWARGKGLSLIYDEVYEGPVQVHMRQRSQGMNAGLGALGVGSRWLSFGLVDLGLSDCIMIIRKPVGDPAHGSSGSS